MQTMIHYQVTEDLVLMKAKLFTWCSHYTSVEIPSNAHEQKCISLITKIVNGKDHQSSQ